MKLMNLNINGLKAFYNRGEGEGSLLDELLNEFDPDVLIFNETKCSKEDYQYWLSEWTDKYALVSAPNQYKAGYAGVGMMLKKTGDPKLLFQVSTPVMIDSEYDTGRIITLEYEDFYLVGTYVLNSGDKDDLRIEWDKEFREYLKTLQADKPVIILGDLNVCRAENDCWEFETYFDEMPGVKGYEIEDFANLLSDGYIDSFRKFHPEDEQYSWFSYRGNSRWTNKGFRLDYALVDKRLEDKIINSSILGGACQYSDHSPILLEINI